MMRRHFVMALMLALGACTTVVPPLATTPPPSSLGPFGQAVGANVEPAPLPSEWWRLFDDPALDGHIARALAVNTDIRVALANLEVARATFRQARATIIPVAGIESGAGPDRADRQPSTSNVPKTSYELGATFAYEVDLFGRLRAATSAAKADTATSAAALDAARVMVAADTAAAYINICGANAAIKLAQAQIATHEQSVALVARRVARGSVSSLELAQSKALLERTRATLFPMEADRKRSLFSLAALQGQAPAEADMLRIGCTAIPTVKATIPVGDGAALIARRPDIREAQSRLLAATARIGVAAADFYPRISLGGSAGLIGGGFDAILTPLISWSFINQGAIRAKVAAAHGGQAAALASWDAAILRALREVETVLADYQAEHRRHAALALALRESEAASSRALVRYQLGADSFLVALDAERTRNEAALMLSSSNLRIGQIQISLFRALGGGWENGPAIATAN